MKRFLIVSLLFSLSAAAAGCTRKQTSDEDNPQPVRPIGVSRSTPEDRKTAAESVNQFGLDLFARLDKDRNVVFSPLSISSALAMTYGGARGHTAKEMAKTLHFRLDNPDLHPAFAGLVWQVQGSGEQQGHRLHVANGLWMDQRVQILENFLQLMKDNYSTSLKQTDFCKPEDARSHINAWVARHTANKIRDLLQAGDLSPETRLVLVNTLYFKGEWKRRFSQGSTYDEPFHISPTEKVSVPMMHQTEDFSYFAGEAEKFQLLELPYKDSNLSMVILLPRRLDGLAEFEKKVTTKSLTTWLGQAHRGKIIVALPKFHLTHHLDLADLLRTMGMKDAFDPRKADFSGMTSEPPLFVNKVAHEAWIEVDEKGTEAAAATIAAGKVGSANPQEFRADHPFLFLIRDKNSGSILFLGRVSNPRG